MKEKAIVLSIIALLLIAAAVFFFRPPISKPAFVLSENLHFSRDELILEGFIPETAVFDPFEEKHIYEERPESFYSYRNTDEFQGKKESAIYFVPLSQAVRQLSFTNLPVGKTITVIYGFSDKVKNNPLASGVRLRITLGEEILIEEKIAPVPGLNQKVISLDKHQYTISQAGAEGLPRLVFEIILDGPNQDWTHFYVDGFIT